MVGCGRRYDGRDLLHLARAERIGGVVSYRPITDVWILARSKTKYYGAYPAGFLHRARALLGVASSDPVLHICAGRVRDYPFRGFGKWDKTLDNDPALAPDFCRDARDPLPLRLRGGFVAEQQAYGAWPISPLAERPVGNDPWPAVLIDRPYTEDDAAHYANGAGNLPDLNDLLKRALQIVPLGGRIGVLDYLWPHPGKHGVEVAVIGIGTGRNGRARWFTVFERVA